MTQDQAIEGRLDFITTAVTDIRNVLNTNVLRPEYLPFSEVRQHFINALADQGLYESYKANVAMLLNDRYGITDHATRNAAADDILNLLFPANEQSPRGTSATPARRIIHIRVGNENWDPSTEELQKIVEMFQRADLDPIGGTIVTDWRVQLDELNAGGDYVSDKTPKSLSAEQYAEAVATSTKSAEPKALYALADQYAKMDDDRPISEVLKQVIDHRETPVDNEPVAVGKLVEVTAQEPTVRHALVVEAHHVPATYGELCADRRLIQADWRLLNLMPTFLQDRAICDSKYISSVTTFQLLPYAVLRNINTREIFMYARGKGGAEARLIGNLSIGVGGHVDRAPAQDESLLDLLQEECLREVEEEVGLCLANAPHFSHLIRDTTNNVGKVHMGILTVIDVDASAVSSKEPGIIDSGTWVQPADLLKEDIFPRLESWSQEVALWLNDTSDIPVFGSVV